MREYDVLIIGAGAAGLNAALELGLTGRRVCVIEAKEKCGGRINTFYTHRNYPIEAGAEFVHGNLPVTLGLLEKAGIKVYKVEGSIWQKKKGELQEQEDFIEDFRQLEKKFKELKHDIPVSVFLNDNLAGDRHKELRFTLKNYMEGYYAADINKASTYALREELTKGDDVNYRIEGGYQQLISYLEQQCREKEVDFLLHQPVAQLHWHKNSVEAVTGTTSIKAKKALITVPIGVLQAGAITFYPALPEKQEAAKKLGFGSVLKINFHFKDSFWQKREVTNGNNLSDLHFLFSEEEIPTWWTQHPKNENILVGWLGGPKAKALSILNHEVIVSKALLSIAGIFQIDIDFLNNQLQEVKFYNWCADPQFVGAYSYAVLDGELNMKKILEPVESTIYFAGEGLHYGIDIGTVEAALVSGKEVAYQLITDEWQAPALATLV